MVPDEVVADGHFDVVAVGEAELALGELADALAAGRDPTGVPNMRFPAGSRWNARAGGTRHTAAHRGTPT